MRIQDRVVSPRRDPVLSAVLEPRGAGSRLAEETAEAPVREHIRPRARRKAEPFGLWFESDQILRAVGGERTESVVELEGLFRRFPSGAWGKRGQLVMECREFPFASFPSRNWRIAVPAPGCRLRDVRRCGIAREGHGRQRVEQRGELCRDFRGEKASMRNRVGKVGTDAIVDQNRVDAEPEARPVSKSGPEPEPLAVRQFGPPGEEERTLRGDAERCEPGLLGPRCVGCLPKPWRSRGAKCGLPPSDRRPERVQLDRVRVGDSVGVDASLHAVRCRPARVLQSQGVRPGLLELRDLAIAFDHRGDESARSRLAAPCLHEDGDGEHRIEHVAARSRELWAEAVPIIAKRPAENAGAIRVVPGFRADPCSRRWKDRQEREARVGLDL